MHVLLFTKFSDILSAYQSIKPNIDCICLRIGNDYVEVLRTVQLCFRDIKCGVVCL